MNVKFICLDGNSVRFQHVFDLMLNVETAMSVVTLQQKKDAVDADRHGERRKDAACFLESAALEK